jgi:hypothetical protein
MSLSLVDIIQNSLPQFCNNTNDKKQFETLSVNEFFKRIRYNSNQDAILVEIVRAYLRNMFSVIIKSNRDDAESIFISLPSRSMLMEPNFLFRFIEHLPEIIFLIDELEGSINRLNSLRVLMNRFKKRTLFSFLNYAEIDDVEKICFLTTLHFYMKGESCPSLQDVCKYLPKSYYFEFINRIENDRCILIQQDLIKLSFDNFRFEKGIKIQSRGIALMCNEFIPLV